MLCELLKDWTGKDGREWPAGAVCHIDDGVAVGLVADGIAHPVEAPKPVKETPKGKSAKKTR